MIPENDIPDLHLKDHLPRTLMNMIIPQHNLKIPIAYLFLGILRITSPADQSHYITAVEHLDVADAALEVAFERLAERRGVEDRETGLGAHRETA